MPIYEYQCNKCGRIYEELVQSSDDSIDNRLCVKPKCDGVGKRIMSPANYSMHSPSSEKGHLCVRLTLVRILSKETVH